MFIPPVSILTVSRKMAKEKADSARHTRQALPAKRSIGQNKPPYHCAQGAQGDFSIRLPDPYTSEFPARTKEARP